MAHAPTNAAIFIGSLILYSIFFLNFAVQVDAPTDDKTVLSVSQAPIRLLGTTSSPRKISPREEFSLPQALGPPPSPQPSCSVPPSDSTSVRQPADCPKFSFETSEQAITVYALWDYDREQFGLWHHRALESVFAVYPRAKVNLLLPVSEVCNLQPFTKDKCDGLTISWVDKYVKLGYNITHTVMTPLFLKALASRDKGFLTGLPGYSWFSANLDLIVDKLSSSHLNRHPLLMWGLKLMLLHRSPGVLFDFRSIILRPLKHPHNYFYVSRCGNFKCPQATGNVTFSESHLLASNRPRSKVLACALEILDACGTACQFDSLIELVKPCLTPKSVLVVEECARQCERFIPHGRFQCADSSTPWPYCAIPRSLIKIDALTNSDVWLPPPPTSILSCVFAALVSLPRPRTFPKVSCAHSLASTPRNDVSCGLSFVIPGVMKSGTTSLFKCLETHPQVILPTVGGQSRKEIHCYDRWEYGRDDGGPELCTSRIGFLEERDNLITGDGTITYSLGRDVPATIAKQYPDLKAIFLLRNPTSRAWSHYRFVRHEEIIAKRSFPETIDWEINIMQNFTNFQTGTIDYYGFQDFARKKGFLRSFWGLFVYVSLYEPVIRHWAESFPRSQILVLSTDKLYSEPQATAQKMARFLGLSPFSNDTKCVMANKGRGHSERMDPATEVRLKNLFAPFNKRLYEYLGEDLGWETV